MLAFAKSLGTWANPLKWLGQNPNRARSEHPNPTTKTCSKMGGAPKTPKWYRWF